MKTSQNVIIFLSLSMMILAGCKKQLDIYNPSVVTTEYYNTRLGQEKLVVDLYSKYRQVFNASTLQLMGTDMYMADRKSVV